MVTELMWMAVGAVMGAVIGYLLSEKRNLEKLLEKKS